MPASKSEIEFLVRARDQASTALKGVGNSMRALGRGSEDTSESIKQVTHHMTELNQSVELLGRSINFLRRTVGSVLQSFSDYDKAMTVVRRVTDSSAQEMERFSVGFDAMVGRIKAVPVERLYRIIGAAAQLGIQGGSNILRFTETVAKLETSLAELGLDAPKLIVRVLNATGEGHAGIERFGNVLVRMAKSAASSESRILHMTALIAQATAQFDLGSESLLALATSAADLNFMPELFGTSVSRALTKLKDAALNGGEGMKKLTEITKMNKDEFLEFLKAAPDQAFLRFAKIIADLNKGNLSVTKFLRKFGLEADEVRRILGSVSKNVDFFKQRLAEARLESILQVALNQEFSETLKGFFATVSDAAQAWTLFKKQLGGKLAPVATEILKAIARALDGIRILIRNSPDWLGELIAWGLALIPILIGVGVAVKVLGLAFVGLGGGAIIGGIGKLISGIILAGSKVVALTGALAGASFWLISIIGSTTVAGLAAIASGIALITKKLQVLIAVMSLFTVWGARFAKVAVVLGVISAFAIKAKGALAGLAAILAGIAGYIFGIPIGIAAIITGVVVALGGAAVAIYRRLDEIMAAWEISWIDFGKAIGEAIIIGVSDAVEWTKEKLYDLWAYIRGEESGAEGPPPIDPELLRSRLNKVDRETLEKAIALTNQQIKDMKPDTSLKYLRLIENQKFLSGLKEILDFSDQANDDELRKKVKNIKNNRLLKDFLKLVEPDTSDLSRVSTISEADLKTIRDLDDFSKNTAIALEQIEAVDRLREHRKEDFFFTSLGLENTEEIDEYINRLAGRAQEALRRADPLIGITESLEEELKRVQAVTAIARNHLEIENKITEAVRARGDLNVEENQKLKKLVQNVQQARKAAAIEGDLKSIQSEIEDARAYTQVQKDSLAIQTLLNKRRDEHGRIDEHHSSRLVEKLRELHRVQAANRFRDRTKELNAQLALAVAQTKADRDRLKIKQALAVFDREVGGNNERERERTRNSFERQITLLQQIENIKSVKANLFPEIEAYNQYKDALHTIRLAQDQKMISDENAIELTSRLNKKRQESLNPLHGELRAMKEKIKLARLTNAQASVERATISQTNTLRERNIILIDSEIEKLRNLNQAMAELETARSSGFEGWANELGTVNERILAMQKDFASSLSSTLVDAFSGAEVAWDEFFASGLRRLAEFHFDTALQSIAKGIGNDLGGLLPGLSTSDAQAKAKTASDRVTEMLDKIIKANEIKLEANQVQIQTGIIKFDENTKFPPLDDFIQLEDPSIPPSNFSVPGFQPENPNLSTSAYFGRGLQLENPNLSTSGISDERVSPDRIYNRIYKDNISKILTTSKADIKDIKDSLDVIKSIGNDGHTERARNNFKGLRDFIGDLKKNDNTGPNPKGSSFLDLISTAEGTNITNGYNTSLRYGMFLPGGKEQKLTSMTLREILALGNQMLKHPVNTYNSSALGRYQIVGATLGGKNRDGSGGLIKQEGLSLDQLFTPELQDHLATVLLRGRIESGQGVEGVRAEWRGLDESEAQAVIDAYERLNNAATKSGASVSGMSVQINQAGGKFKDLGAAVTNFKSVSELSGDGAQVAAKGTDLADQATRGLGSAAAQAAPSIDRAANALRSLGGAGGGARGGAGGGLGGGSDEDSGLGGALLSAGLGIGLSLLSGLFSRGGSSGSSNEGPRLEVFDDVDRRIGLIDWRGRVEGVGRTDERRLNLGEENIRGQNEQSDMSALIRELREQAREPQRVSLEVGVSASEDFDVRMQETSRSTSVEVMQVGLDAFNAEVLPERVLDVIENPTNRN